MSQVSTFANVLFEMLVVILENYRPSKTALTDYMSGMVSTLEPMLCYVSQPILAGHNTFRTRSNTKRVFVFICNSIALDENVT